MGIGVGGEYPLSATIYIRYYNEGNESNERERGWGKKEKKKSRD